ncbi:hypothetical protein ASF40_20190 [Microbacterium sp. Leaf288]|uniref:hypothetical protein n=1 Tax=Microbacterium sp. Leaf288 TaxID=1736323 RepID=UPI0006FBDC60|nr:hypothetical protein [Microbacterium sp. Leaf288]KQP67851.1 hypothetical protein ASF40_20190 [Microbacterium sp. Leaf288]
MPTQIFATYRLHDGVDPAAFVKWSREVDQPACRQAPAIHSFKVYLVAGDSVDIKGGVVEGNSFNVVEDIVAESWDALQATFASEDWKEIGSAWGTFADENSLQFHLSEVI